MFNISRQTLIYYDKQDLFHPAFRDPNNGYRVYSVNQLAPFSFIMYLHNIGFSVKQIKNMMKSSRDDTIKELHNQSEKLKRQYEELLYIDDIIQRKIGFVQNRLDEVNLDEVWLEEFPSRSYIKIGFENKLYEAKAFYHLPTIVFYKYENDSYNKFFGAYDDDLDRLADGEELGHVPSQKFLCFYHCGPYSLIIDSVTKIRNEYSYLSLSHDFICVNIVDQFLESDDSQFITQVQIPVLSN